MTGLGKWLEERMEERHMTQNAVRDRVGIGASTINGILRKGHIPSWETLNLLADYFKWDRQAVYEIAGVLKKEDDRPLHPQIEQVVRELAELPLSYQAEVARAWAMNLGLFRKGLEVGETEPEGGSGSPPKP